MMKFDEFSIGEINDILDKANERCVLNVHPSEYSIGVYHGNCPRCGKSVMDTVRDGFDPSLYCRYCGQKLKWKIGGDDDE